MSKLASSTPAGSSDTTFGRLWLARDVAALADWVVFVAMLSYVGMFSDTPTSLGSLFTIFLAPRFILWPIASRLVTWRNAVVTGVLAQAVRAAALVPAFLLSREDGFQPIMMMAAAYTVAGPFLGAAQQTLFGLAVGERQRSNALKALLSTWLLTLTIGPAFGYAAYANGGLRSAAAATLVAVAVSAVMLMMSRPPGPVDVSTVARPHLLVGFAPLQEGIATAFRDPVLQQVAGVQIIAAVLAGGVGVLEGAYTTNGLFVAIENIGILLASQGFGIAVAGFWYQRVGERYPFNSLVAAGLALIGSGELGLAISSALPVGLGFTAVIGVGFGLLALSMTNLSREHLSASGERKPPAIGIRTIVDGAIVLSAMAAAPLCLSISPRFTLVLTGTLIWVLALYAFGAVQDLSSRDETSAAHVHQS